MSQEQEAPRDFSRRQVLIAGGVVLLGEMVLPGTNPIEGMTMSAVEQGLTKGQVKRLLRAGDAAEARLGDRITNPIGRTNLGLRSHIVESDPVTGQQSVALENPNPDRRYNETNQAGIDRVKDRSRRLREGTIETDGSGREILVLDGPQRRWVDLTVQPLPHDPEGIKFSEELIGELNDPQRINIDGQRINTVFANRSKLGNNEAFVWLGLFGNQADKAESRLRVGAIANRMKDNPVFAFDPPAQGGSDGFTKEQEAALERGDFSAVVKPYLQILKKYGFTKVNFFGSSLGAQLSLTAASMANQFGMDVGTVGAYGIPIMDHNAPEPETIGLKEKGLRKLYGSRKARLMMMDFEALGDVDLYHSRPVDPQLIFHAGVDRSAVAKVGTMLGAGIDQLRSDRRQLYAGALAQNTPERVAELGKAYLASQPDGTLYFRSGSEDQLSPVLLVREVTSRIRERNPDGWRVSRQIDEGLGHLANVQPLVLAGDIERNSRPIARPATGSRG